MRNLLKSTPRDERDIKLVKILFLALGSESPRLPPVLSEVSAIAARAMFDRTSTRLRLSGVTNQSPYWGFKASRALLLLAAHCENWGHESRYIQVDYELSHSSSSMLKDKLISECASADLVAVSAYTPNFQFGLELLKVCKSANPALTTVVGGPHVTYVPTDPLLRDVADFVVVGDGIAAFREIILKVERRAIIPKFHQESIVVRGALDDLNDQTMPAYHLVPSAARSNCCVPIETSRGCPFSCAFCVEGNMWGKVRFRPIEVVVQEINLIRNVFGFDLLHLCDSIFPMKPSRVKDLCAAIGSETEGLKFSCNVRVESDRNGQIEAMAEAGFLMFFLGIESASDQVLKSMNKDVTAQKYYEFLRRIRSSCGVMSTSWLVGHPGETRETIEASVGHLRAMLGEGLIDEAWSRPFVPYPGAPVVESGAVEVLSQDWSKYASMSAELLCDVKTISPADVLRGFAEMQFTIIDAISPSDSADMGQLKTTMNNLFARIAAI